MKKAENIRQEIFDKINAMSDDELARVIWKSRMCNSGVKGLAVISIVLWFIAILQNATYSITIFWLLALLCIVCTIAFIILIDKLGHFESRIVGVIAITTALCFTIGGEQFLLRLPYFKWLSSLIALFLLTDLVAIYRKGSARIEKCEENAAKTAFFCRKQQQPFTIEQIPDPVSWKYDVAAAIIQFCMCFILFFKVVLQLYQYDYCWSSNMLEEEYFNYVRNISILLLTTVGIIEAINYLISRSFSWRDFFIRKLWIFLFIGAMYVLPSVLYTAIVDHGYQWPADYTIPERTVYYYVRHNNSILFKEQISQKIIRTSPNLVVRITVPRHAQFSYRTLTLFNPIISEKRYDSAKPRFEEIEYTLSKEIKNMEYDPNDGYLGKISI